MDPAPAGLDGLTRPEQVALRDLLIRATVAARPDGDRTALEWLVQAAPIGALPTAAWHHRVAGSVLRGLDGAEGVPSGVRAELAAVRQRSALNHLLVTAALGDIGRRFDEAGLRWVVIKGPVVAALLYPDVGDRSYGDLDLLVDRRDFGAAIRILEELGYGHTIHNWALAERMLAGELGMVDGRVHVDLHWHLHYSRQDRRPYAFDPEAMIERSRRVVISGVTVPTLDPVDTLLTVAFHAARSDGHRLVWFKDLERALDVDNPDLGELVLRSRAYRCGPPVGLMLARARALLGADVPDEVIRALSPTPLLIADRLASAVDHPIQLHERTTITRVLTRSVRSSLASSVGAIPVRSVRLLHRRIRPPAPNETDSPDEKASYLDAVAASIDH